MSHIEITHIPIVQVGDRFVFTLNSVEYSLRTIVACINQIREIKRGDV